MLDLLLLGSAMPEAQRIAVRIMSKSGL